MSLTATITCPHCGHSAEETIPAGSCLFFYPCVSCGTKLRPREGDCCVFCSYGSRPCPSAAARKEDAR